MLKALRFAVALLVLTASGKALAADAALQIDGDLIVHPTQLAKFFSYAASQVQTSARWAWSDLEFTSPYKTSWTNVVAQGPFALTFDTSNLKSNQIAFTMTWASPKIAVGGFAIHDTLTQVVSGTNLVIHLDGSCTGLSMNIPNANWVIKGTMHWDYQAQAFVPSWTDFNFSSNTAAVPAINLGQCDAPLALNDQLKSSFNAVLTDQTWLGTVFQQGLLNWMQTTLGDMQSQLLAPRAMALSSSLNGVWQPQALSALPGGLLRVAGALSLAKTGSTVGAAHVARNYAVSNLNAVTQSGFVLPSGTMQALMSYLYANGVLQYRVNSSSVSAFQSLMGNSFQQFLVWPDLMSFNQNTNFVFDLTSSAAPKIGQGYMLTGGGSSYAVQAPIVAHQWAPSPLTGAMLPYVDFTSPMNGLVSAKISSGKLNLSMQTSDLSLNAAFRREYAAVRSENTWIATSLISPEVQSYLNSTSYSVAVPSWALSAGVNLQMSDIQVYTQSLRIPLDFVTQP